MQLKASVFYAIADAVHIKLTLDTKEGRPSILSGRTRTIFKSGCFKLPFALRVVSSLASSNENACIVLFDGPGDMALVVAYSAKSDGLVAYVLDSSLLGECERIWERGEFDSVVKALKSIRGGAVAAWSKDRAATGWSEIKLTS